MCLPFQNCTEGFSAKTSTSLSLDAPETEDSTSLEEEAAEEANQPKLPDFIVTGIPTEPIREENLTISIQWNEDADRSKYFCRSNTIELEQCQETYEITGLSEGTYQFMIVSEDTSVTFFSESWSVDLPELSITLDKISSLSPLEKRDVAYTIIDDFDSNFDVTCSLDRISLDDCSSPIQLRQLSEGDHTLIANLVSPEGEILASDSAEWRTNISAFRFELVTAPWIDEQGVPSARQLNLRSFDLGFALTNPTNDQPETATMQCELSRRAYAESDYSILQALGPCSFPTLSYSDLDDGYYRARYLVTDRLNREYERQISFTLDATTITNFDVMVNDNFSTHHRSVVIPFGADVPDENIYSEDIFYRVIGHQDEFVQWNYSLSRSGRASFLILNDLQIGSYTIEMYAQDRVGNRVPMQSRGFTVTENQTIFDEYSGGFFWFYETSQPHDVSPNLIGSTPEGLVVVPKSSSGETQTSASHIKTHFNYWKSDYPNSVFKGAPFLTNSASGLPTRVVYLDNRYAVLWMYPNLLTLDLQNPNQPKIVGIHSKVSERIVHPIITNNGLFFAGFGAPGSSVGDNYSIYRMDTTNPRNITATYTGHNLDLSLPNDQSIGLQELKYNNSGERLVARGRVQINEDQRQDIVRTYSFGPDGTTEILATLESGPNQTFRTVKFDQNILMVRHILLNQSTSTEYLNIYNPTTLTQVQRLQEPELCRWEFTIETSSNGIMTCFDANGTKVFKLNNSQYTLEATIPDVSIDFVESNTEFYSLRAPSSIDGYFRFHRYENQSLNLQWFFSLTAYETY